MQLLWNTLALWAITTFVSPLSLLANYPILEPCPAQERPTGGEITDSAAQHMLPVVQPCMLLQNAPASSAACRGQHWGQCYLSSSLNLHGGTRARPQQGHRWDKTRRSGWCTRWLCHYSEGPGLPGEMGQWESHEFQQREMQRSQSLLFRSTPRRASLLSQSFMAIVHKLRKLPAGNLLKVPSSLCIWGYLLPHTLISMLASSCHCCPQTRHPLSDNLLETHYKTSVIWGENMLLTELRQQRNNGQRRQHLKLVLLP